MAISKVLLKFAEEDVQPSEHTVKQIQSTLNILDDISVGVRASMQEDKARYIFGSVSDDSLELAEMLMIRQFVSRANGETEAMRMAYMAWDQHFYRVGSFPEYIKSCLRKGLWLAKTYIEEQQSKN